MKPTILHEIKKSSITRLNSTLKIIFLIHVLLFLTVDVYNYTNNIWNLFPSQYYYLINHVFSAPIIIVLIVMNRVYIEKINTLPKFSYDLVVVINMLSILPFVLVYYYWELHDYRSGGILIIVIFVFGIMLKLNALRLIVLAIYYFGIYFGMLYYFGIKYADNPAIYLSGTASILIFYFLSKNTYEVSYKAIENEMIVIQKNDQLYKTKLKIEENLVLLNKQNKELELSNKDLLSFAQVAAHDIKTPLRTISNFTKIFSEKYMNEIKEEDKIIQETIIKTCVDLTQITEGLLEFSRISNKDIIAFYPLDFNKLIKDVIILLDDSITKQKPKIVIQESFPEIVGVRDLLIRLMINLINNALKFSRKRELITIDISHQLIDYNLVQISIKDNGIGIPEERYLEIFELFRKLHNPNEFDGNGLGLAISKRIVEKHGGNIWVESEVGNGATFHFTLRLNS